MGNSYLGSKATSGLCQAIIALMPPHHTFIESHLGGGAIMKRKPAAQRNIGIDLDAKAIADFSCDYPVELVHGCAHDYLAGFDYDGGELAYCDPPYLRSTRKSPHRYRYRYDYEQADHVALLKLLKALPCKVMVSGYPSALYDEWLPNWRTRSVQVMNQAGVVTEKIWFNFEPVQFHWVRYTGRDFSHRQTIKRRAQSWARRYEKMPPDERLAVLAAVMAVDAQS